MSAILPFDFQKENNDSFQKAIILITYTHTHPHTHPHKVCVMRITFSLHNGKPEQPVDPFRSP